MERDVGETKVCLKKGCGEGRGFGFRLSGVSWSGLEAWGRRRMTLNAMRREPTRGASARIEREAHKCGPCFRVEDQYIPWLQRHIFSISFYKSTLSQAAAGFHLHSLQSLSKRKDGGRAGRYSKRSRGQHRHHICHIRRIPRQSNHSHRPILPGGTPPYRIVLAPINVPLNKPHIPPIQKTGQRTRPPTRRIRLQRHRRAPKTRRI